MSDNRTRTVNGIQGVVAFAGILLGLIPLAARLITGEHTGPFRLLFGTPAGAMAYVAPALVIGATIVLIAILEALERRG